MKNKYNIILLTIISLTTIILFICPIKSDSIQYNGSSRYPLPELKKNDNYIINFKSSLNDLNKISFRFATYGIINRHGQICVSIFDNSKLIKKEIIDLKNIKDNELYYMNFSKQKNSLNKTYKVYISYKKYYSDNKLTLYGDYYNDNELYTTLNDNKNDLTIYSQIYGTKNDYRLCIYSLLLLIGYLIILTCGGDKDVKE